MYRKKLLRGVSAGAISLVCLAVWPQAASAQQSLPTINVGGSQKAQRIASAPRGKPTATGRATTANRVVSPGGGGGGASVQTAQSAPGETLGEKLDPDAPKSIWSPTLPNGRPAFVEKWHLPNTVASITRKQIETKINIVDTEDAVKYMPSLFVRKRNNGDTQAVLQTRTWGVNSSARSLVYADDLLLTALIANDNTQGAPRWGLVAPEEIERVDFLYGPYAAEYPGNSMGGVLKITTRMPEKLTVTAKNITSYQDYSQYGTQRLFVNNVTQIFVGDKVGDFSWNVSGNWQRGSQQPLTFVTNATSGVFQPYPSAWYQSGKFNQPTTVLGATGNLANDQVNAKFKGAYDINATTRATYTLGFWSNDGTSNIQNYLIDGGGPYWGGKPGRTLATTPAPALGTSALQQFGAGYYRVQEKMLVNSGAVKSNTNGLFDYEISASNFSYLQSNQNSPWSGAFPYGGWTQFGRTIKNGGTYWTLLDAKGILRPDSGLFKGHAISFGLHGDQFNLNNPTYWNYSWTGGESTAYGFAQTISRGTTRTKALWMQDAFDIVPDLKLTTGVRAENWIASNGVNQAQPGSQAATGFGYTSVPKNAAALMMPIYQPNLYSTRWSPKGSLEYKIDEKWTVNGNIGMANRFPTVKELYNLSFNSASGNNVQPNPYLRPEVALTKEINFQRTLDNEGGNARVALFDEEVRDAIVGQTTLNPGPIVVATTNNVNIQRIRNSGVEVALQKNNVLLKGLEMTGSATWVNSRIISDPTWAPTTTAASPASVLSGNYDSWCLSIAGKNMPYVPEWRGTVTATWRPDDHWAFTAAARYQSKVWSTLSNNDYGAFGYQAWSGFTVVDIKTAYKYNDHLTFDFGVDNLNNQKYWLFHPFPQRTFYMSGKYELGAVKKGDPGIFASAFTGGESGAPDVANWVQPVGLSID